VDFEQAIETQRLRLLRIVAGLIILLGVLSLGPVSRGFSVWTCRFVESILSRAEAAARYLIIAHAYQMIARSGMDLNRKQISESLAREFATDGADVSLSECQRRLKVLRAVLKDLPRAALRLLRLIEKQSRRAMSTDQPSRFPHSRLSTSLHDWRLAGMRIERLPDIGLRKLLLFLPPCGIRAGGVDGCATILDVFLKPHSKRHR